MSRIISDRQFLEETLAYKKNSLLALKNAQATAVAVYTNSVALLQDQIDSIESQLESSKITGYPESECMPEPGVSI